MTPAIRAVIDAVVSINETGKLPSPAAYSTCTILADGAGISYGKHQGTDRSDTLDAIVQRYLELGGTALAGVMSAVARLHDDATTVVDPNGPKPTWVVELVDALRAAGSDPLMQQAQDEVFDRGYWNPAESKCKDMGLVTALAHLVCYDTAIHSGPTRIDALRRLFPEASPSRGGIEHSWVIAFLRARRDWLAGHSNPVVRKTVDRVDALRKLADAGLWELTVPFRYRFGLMIQ